MYDFSYLVKLLNIIHVMSVMDSIEPVTSVNPKETRLVIAAAIVAATDDPDEQSELIAFAKWESFFRTDVLDCKRKGGGFSLGPWQVAPFSAQERKLLCSDLVGSAKLALQRMKDSKRYCRHLPESHRYAQYATGSCSHPQGANLSKVRWATAKKVRAMYNDTP